MNGNRMGMFKNGGDIPAGCVVSGQDHKPHYDGTIIYLDAGADLAQAAADALDKIESVLPDALKRETRRSRLFAVDFHVDKRQAATLDLVRRGINEKRVISFDYTRADGATSHRSVRPLGLFFWGPVWTLGAWCEMRTDFRNFRPDRMTEAVLAERTFADEPGRTFEDFLRSVERRAGEKT